VFQLVVLNKTDLLIFLEGDNVFQLGCSKNSQEYRFGQVGRVLFWEIKSQFAERTLGCREWDFFFTRACCYFVLTVYDTDLSSDFHVVCF
jgi:hypothetical protein